MTDPKDRRKEAASMVTSGREMVEIMMRCFGPSDGSPDGVKDAVAVAMKAFGSRKMTAVTTAAADDDDSTTEEAAGREPGSDHSGWKMTSVRWLRANFPMYVAGSRSSSTAHTLLNDALARMSYEEAETLTEGGAIDRKHAAAMRKQALTCWGQKAHEDLVGFLNAGGYSALVETMRAKWKLVDQKDAQADTAPRARKTKASKRTPEVEQHGQSLDDVVRELSNPVMGSW